MTSEIEIALRAATGDPVTEEDEVKGPTGRLRPEQAVFLELINGAGGVGFMARDCRDVLAALGPMRC